MQKQFDLDSQMRYLETINQERKFDSKMALNEVDNIIRLFATNMIEPVYYEITEFKKINNFIFDKEISFSEELIALIIRQRKLNMKSIEFTEQLPQDVKTLESNLREIADEERKIKGLIDENHRILGVIREKYMPLQSKIMENIKKIDAFIKFYLHLKRLNIDIKFIVFKHSLYILAIIIAFLFDKISSQLLSRLEVYKISSGRLGILETISIFIIFYLFQNLFIDHWLEEFKIKNQWNSFIYRYNNLERTKEPAEKIEAELNAINKVIIDMRNQIDIP